VEQHRKQGASWSQSLSIQDLSGVLQTLSEDERICGMRECRAILFQTLENKSILGHSVQSRVRLQVEYRTYHSNLGTGFRETVS